jgi:hypothetical protein
MIQVPATIRDEISDVARRAQRSSAFVAHRALLAARDTTSAPPEGESVALLLATDEDDPIDLLRKLDAALQNNSLPAAWRASREKFFAWVAKLDAAREAERADDLDAALHDAAHASTSPARLTALAQNEYPRVRVLVARHPCTPPDVLAELRRDADRAVREAARAALLPVEPPAAKRLSPALPQSQS